MSSTYDTTVISSMEGWAKGEQVRVQFFQSRLNYLVKHGEAFAQMLAEPYILDDMWRVSLEDLIKYILLNSETLIVLDQGAVVGICIFNWIKRPREADLTAWVAPEYRGSISRGRKISRTFKQDIIGYAWQRMNITKLRTACSIANRPAIRFAKNVGFREVGIARKDLLINGQYSDSYLFECVNPAFDVTEIEVFKGDNQRKGTNRKPAIASADVGEFEHEPDGERDTEWRVQYKPTFKLEAEHPGQLFSADSIDELVSTPNADSKPDSYQRVFTGFSPPVRFTDSE